MKKCFSRRHQLTTFERTKADQSFFDPTIATILQSNITDGCRCHVNIPARHQATTNPDLLHEKNGHWQVQCRQKTTDAGSRTLKQRERDPVHHQYERFLCKNYSACQTCCLYRNSAKNCHQRTHRQNPLT